MKFDDFLRVVGEMGPYQRRLYVLLSLPTVSYGAIVILLVVFLFSVPEHRCAIPGLNNDTYQIQNNAHEYLINLTIPMVPDNHGDLKFSSCDMYSSLNSSAFKNETYQCSSWVYDKKVFISTISEMLDFVCGRKSFTTHAKMLGMIGQFLGVLITGPLSDLFGRRTVILAGMLTAVISGISLTWVSSFYVLIPVVILISAGYNTIYLACFIYNMEMVGSSKRTFVGVAMNLFWSAGNLIVALVAFLIRDWKIRQLVLSVPGVLFVYLYFVPESPRWLLCKGREKEARKTLEKMAEMNHKVLSPDVLDNVKGVYEPNRDPFSRLLKSPTMRVRLSIIFYNWFAIGMGYYGLSMNITNLSGNIYLNFFFFVLLEACAYIICLLLLGRIGRKALMLCFALLCAGIACILTFVPILVSDTPEQWIINTLACVGNTCVSAGFAAVYVFSAELLPTTSRNFGMGIGSVICRIDCIVSPYINDLTLHVSGKYSQVLPMLIFGGITALAGLLALLLPETNNKRLPETIEDAENMGKESYDKDKTTESQIEKMLQPEKSGDTNESAI